MKAPHPIQRRYLAEQIVRLRRADEEERYASSQRQGRIDPNPHQIDAVIFALKRIPEGGCILADEVGLGKTIEAGLVLAQLRAEGAAPRILLIVPKPLLGQWQDELYRLFGIQAVEGRMEPGAFAEEGVFLVGREAAGSERGSAILRDADPFDLCVIDEAHEVFANIYRRYDKDGIYNTESTEARMADRIRGFLRQSPVLLLTATPIQNNLTELWGLVQYVEPTGTLLGNLRTFRDLFCEGDDRLLVKGQDDELRRRIATVVQRTLRRQAQEFLERPFVGRRAQIYEFAMEPREKSLYDDVTAYLLEPQLFAFRGNQRQLLLIGFHRLMGSSIAALAASLRKVAQRLQRLLETGVNEPDAHAAGRSGLRGHTGEMPRRDRAEDAGRRRSRPGEGRKELQRVRDFIQRAETLPRDSKTEKLLEVTRIIAERSPERQRVVIFTESLVTQDYLRQMLVARGGYVPEAVTLFRGTNESPRANQALQRWEEEVGRNLPSYQKPSRTVAVRLALVHEFKTRSQVFISTEAGAKGLNLQFCDTIINYDLPWNPQRIEQRIGRCHRYGQEHDVTVINFLASDNEAQRLTFEILSRKLDLFGKVLDASDDVLHEPSTDAPETLVGALGNDFEAKLRRIYERARTVDEIEAELRRLREEMEEQRNKFEETWARTAGLIETRFDQRVKQAFRRLQADLPRGLARLDGELDQLIAGYLSASGIAYLRQPDDGHVRFEVAASPRLPEGFEKGATVVAGRGNEADGFDSLHPGHPLVQAAIEEARAATEQRFRVTWKLDRSAPEELRVCKGKPGRLVLSRVRYDGFERTDRLIPTVLMESSDSPLGLECALAARQAAAPRHGIHAADAGRKRNGRRHRRDGVPRSGRSLGARAGIVRSQHRADRALSGGPAGAHAPPPEHPTKVAGYRGRPAGQCERGGGQGRRRKADPRRAKPGRRIGSRDSKARKSQRCGILSWRDRAHERRYRLPEVIRILDVEFVLE